MLESLIEKYGYLAILLGTFSEGETILVLGGFSAHRGYLLLSGVILAAFCGSLMGDQLFFFLGRRNSREKKFSLIFFDPQYLSRFSTAVIRVRERIAAFANLWPSAGLEELSVDLMRYHPNTPEGLMEYLFIEILLWGKQRSYRWFNLGMAPLSI